ncbi:hypothetical protein THERMOT_2238 [Bathymodiolus thermophilus thioautotrophic gill symbiont]|nr:hypothetical protein THERMOT_2238 [Bathymodiolus thermophilus thioautotrophic gill symbiont]
MSNVCCSNARFNRFFAFLCVVPENQGNNSVFLGVWRPH